MDTVRRQVPLLIAIIAILVAACGSATTSSDPGASGSPGASSPPPSLDAGPVTTEDQAVAAVVAHEPRFAGITKRDPDMIGQADWYEVQPASGVGAFLVTMRLGWGDCPSGCIDEHSWVYVVGPDGEVTLQSEGGSDVPPDAWPSPGLGGDFHGTGLFILAVAGPICPVETVPPKPECASRPVAGVAIRIRDGQGADVASTSLDAKGSAFVGMPPGDYVIAGAEVAGLMGVPEPQPAVVVDGRATEVVLTYDTGIR